jgi:hypothetical protein
MEAYHEEKGGSESVLSILASVEIYQDAQAQLGQKALLQSEFLQISSRASIALSGVVMVVLVGGYDLALCFSSSDVQKK